MVKFKLALNYSLQWPYTIPSDTSSILLSANIIARFTAWRTFLSCFCHSSVLRGIVCHFAFKEHETHTLLLTIRETYYATTKLVHVGPSWSDWPITGNVSLSFKIHYKFWQRFVKSTAHVIQSSSLSWWSSNLPWHSYWPRDALDNVEVINVHVQCQPTYTFICQMLEPTPVIEVFHTPP